MASIPISEPLDALLSAIPSLPRPVLNRLVERAIDHMDEQDGDADFEEDDPPEDGHDSEWAAWMERFDQTLAPYPFEAPADYRNSEDAEDEHDRENDQWAA